MTKIEKLNEMEKFWKSEERYYRWEDIDWDPLGHKGPSGPVGIPLMDDVEEKVELDGYYFHATRIGAHPNYWDRLLLHHLDAWYSLPEHYNVPIFFDKRALAVCIPLPEGSQSRPPLSTTRVGDLGPRRDGCCRKGRRSRQTPAHGRKWT